MVSVIIMIVNKCVYFGCLSLVNDQCCKWFLLLLLIFYLVWFPLSRTFNFLSFQNHFTVADATTAFCFWVEHWQETRGDITWVMSSQAHTHVKCHGAEQLMVVNLCFYMVTRSLSLPGVMLKWRRSCWNTRHHKQSGISPVFYFILLQLHVKCFSSSSCHIPSLPLFRICSTCSLAWQADTVVKSRRKAGLRVALWVACSNILHTCV